MRLEQFLKSVYCIKIIPYFIRAAKIVKKTLTINRGRCVTLVLLDTLSTKHDHRWIRTYLCVCGMGAADIEVPIFDTY